MFISCPGKIWKTRSSAGSNRQTSPLSTAPLESQILAPLPIGFAVFLVHLATIPITGTGINPAISLGAAIIFNKDGIWITVPVIPHALVINLGDQMQVMANSIFKSPIHRVVTNSDKLRISVAMFNEPEPDKEIGPVEDLISEGQPRLYRNVQNYAAFNYECFQKGKIPLEEVKVDAPRV